MRLIVFSHAGGYAHSYTFFSDNRMPRIEEVVRYEYPARGSKIMTSPYKDFTECIEHITEELTQKYRGESLVLFGHSFGGAVAYEVGRRVDAQLVVVSSMIPPAKDGYAAPLDEKDAECLKEYLLAGSTFPPEVVTNQEMMRYFLETLRQDMKVLGTSARYTQAATGKVKNLAVICGRDEDMEEEALQWSEYAEHMFSVKEMEGDHFYIFKHKDDITNYINQLLIQV